MEKEKQNGEIIQKTDCNMCDGADLLCPLGKRVPMCEDRVGAVTNRNDGKPDCVCRIPMFRSRNTYVFDGMYY